VHHLFVRKAPELPSRVGDCVRTCNVVGALPSSRMRAVAVDLEAELHVDEGEVELDDPSVGQAESNTRHRQRKPGSFEEAEHATLEYRPRHPIQRLATFEDLCHRPDAVASGRAQRGVAPFECRSSKSLIPLGRIERFFDCRGRHDGTEVEERSRERRCWYDANARPINVSEVPRVMDDRFAPPMAYVHRNDNLDHSADVEAVEPMERGRGAV
jgi:hypothetical protein